MSRLFLLALALSVLPAAHAQTCAPGAATSTLNISNVQARLTNHGGLFRTSAGSLYNVPRSVTGTTPNAIYAAGLWLGGMVNGQLRQAAATYGNHEFFPGPLADVGVPPTGCASYDRIYRVSTGDIAAFRSGQTATPDMQAWPVGLGAPAFTDVNNNGLYDPATDTRVVPSSRTQLLDFSTGQLPLLSGDQMAWWLMNDAAGPHATTGSAPMGVEVQVSAYAINLPGDLANATFYRYRLVNRGATAITDTYAGFWADPDLGNGGDDYVGSDSTLRLGYTYNADNLDEGTDGYGAAPPAIGVLVQRGPLVPAAGTNWTDPDGTVYRNQARLGAAAVMSYFTGTGAAGTPATGSDDFYQYLTGRWKDGTTMRACGTGYVSTGGARADCTPTRFAFHGDPVATQGWSERNLFPGGPQTPSTPGDRRFLISTGPFVLAPGGAQEVTFAVIWARGASNLDSVTRLRAVATSLQNQGVATGTENARTTAGLRLDAPVPNPATAGATVRLTLPEPGPVRLHLYDALGRTVADTDAGVRSAGAHVLTLPTAGLGPGLYVVRVEAGAWQATQRLVVAR